MSLTPQLNHESARALHAGRDVLFSRASQKLGGQHTVLHDFRPEDAGATATTGWGTVNITSANTFTDVFTSGGYTIANN